MSEADSANQEPEKSRAGLAIAVIAVVLVIGGGSFALLNLGTYLGNESPPSVATSSVREARDRSTYDADDPLVGDASVPSGNDLVAAEDRSTDDRPTEEPMSPLQTDAPNSLAALDTPGVSRLELERSEPNRVAPEPLNMAEPNSAPGSALSPAAEMSPGGGGDARSMESPAEALSPATRPGELGSAEVADPKVSRPPTRSLASVEPMEVLGVNTVDQGVLRDVRIGDLHVHNAIWAQPDEDQGTSQIGYFLDGGFERLQASAAIVTTSDSVSREPVQLIFRVYGDGNLLWQSEDCMTPGRAVPFEVDLRGIMSLALVVESHSPKEVTCSVWSDAKLVDVVPEHNR